MAGAVERKIAVKGFSKEHYDEGILDTAAFPGMHVQMAADGHYDPSPAAIAELSKCNPIIVTETLQTLQGKTVNDTYAIGDPASIVTPIPGDHTLLYVKSGENLAVHDYVVQEGGGTGKWVKAAGTETRFHYECLEATGALAADTLVKCRKL